LPLAEVALVYPLFNSPEYLCLFDTILRSSYHCPRGHSLVTDDYSAETIQSGLNTRLIGRAIHFFDSLPTTMDVADRLANEGAPEGTAVVANHQTAGRGRFGRTWVTPKGTNIAISLILRPRLEELPRLNMAASLGIVRTIEKCCGLSPSIKWPNDVQLSGKKVSGILITNTYHGDSLGHVNIGIGINVNVDPETLSKIAPPATSLMVETNGHVSRSRVFQTLMEEMERLYDCVRAGGSLLSVWQPYVATIGQQIQVHWRREDMEGWVEQGLAESVDEEGRLNLRLADGTLKTLVAGEVTLHSDAQYRDQEG